MAKLPATLLLLVSLSASAVIAAFCCCHGLHSAAVVLTAFDIPEFPAVAKVSAVAAVPNAFHVPFCCWCF